MQKDAIETLLLELKNSIIILKKELELKTEIIPNNGFFTSKQVCELLQVSENTLQRMREEKRVIYYQIGNFSFRYPADQFLHYKNAA